MEGPLRPFADPASKASYRAFPLDDKDINCVSDESLVDLLRSAPIIYHLGQTTVVRLSKDRVLKGGGDVLPCEAKVLQLVASKSNIRAPRVHRSLNFMDDTKHFGSMGYIVMDYIDGEPLDSCWGDLSDEQKMDVARQTAHMITDMQSIKLLELGPIGGGLCRGRFFTHYSAGPFKDVAEFEGWFNHKLDISETYKHAPSDLPPFKFTEFVFTHQDISPHNLILDRNGLVWLVDWADAGSYPPAFETAALRSQSRFVNFNGMVLSLLPQYLWKRSNYILSDTPFQQLHSLDRSWMDAAWLLSTKQPISQAAYRLILSERIQFYVYIINWNEQG